MTNISESIATLQLRVAAQADESEALIQLIEESLRMRRALKFYANRDNWFDGVPMLKHPEDRLSTVEDDGRIARYALRLDDVNPAPEVFSGE